MAANALHKSGHRRNYRNLPAPYRGTDRGSIPEAQKAFLTWHVSDFPTAPA